MGNLAVSVRKNESGEANVVSRNLYSPFGDEVDDFYKNGVDLLYKNQKVGEFSKESQIKL